MIRKNLLLTGAIGIAASAFAQAKQPNVVLILADDLRGSAMGFLGKEDVITPNLDQFSTEAITLPNAYIMGATNGAVSMPSRAMLFSGKNLHTLVRSGATIPQNHTTMGEALQSNGYTTFHTGKWHNGKEAFNRCFNDGKSVYFGGMSDHFNVPLYDYDKTGQYGKNRAVVESPKTGNKVTYLNGDYILSGLHSVDIFTDVAIDYLEEQSKSDKPFFLSVSYMLPHDPRNTHQKYIDMYDISKIATPDSFVPEHPFDNGELRIRDEKLLPHPRTEEGVKQQIFDYYSCVSHLDAGAGRVIEALKKLGLYDNTIVIFAADNGLALGQHGLLGKQNMYEHSLNVPVMIKDAKANPKGETRDERCFLIDIYPTICEMIGVETPSSVDGKSLKPILDEGKATREYLYYGYSNKQRAISDGEWKLIEYSVKGVRTTQLFNLKSDPKELNDLSKEKKQVKRIEQLRAQMKIEAANSSDKAEWVKNL